MSKPMIGQRFETLHVLHTATNQRPDTYDVKMKYVCPVVMFLISDLNKVELNLLSLRLGGSIRPCFDLKL